MSKFVTLSEAEMYQIGGGISIVSLIVGLSAIAIGIVVIVAGSIVIAL